MTKKPTTMLAYGYMEDQGGKGGNNVASLIVKGLRELGWLKENGSTGKQLSIILDNCGGQNKNNFVLRLALWLVERKFFKKVEMIFYVRGHTKNACDRLFNQLKLQYHRSQVFTMGQMVQLLNSSLNVSFKEARSEDFADYGALLDKFYKKFPAGTIQRNHIFWVDDSNPTRIYTKISDEADVEVLNLQTGQHRDRVQSLQSYNLALIPAPGLKDIKQVELYTKFRKFVPFEFRDEICPRPAQQVIDNIKKARSEKARASRNVRRRKSSS